MCNPEILGKIYYIDDIRKDVIFLKLLSLKDFKFYLGIASTNNRRNALLSKHTLSWR